ncbi:hypothetical protein FQP88_20330 [Vibrio atlanticus]|nr:hypothetical protein FQP88_20330 [Vibrio atlanticus]
MFWSNREKAALTATLNDQNVKVLNADNNYRPLVLNVTINGEKGVIPSARAQSRGADLGSTLVASNYQVEWTLDPALLAPASLTDLQAFEILTPPIPGNYEYTVTVTEKSSGKSQTLTRTLTVGAYAALDSMYFTSVSAVNISRGSSSFEVTKVTDRAGLGAALERYAIKAGGVLIPVLMQHIDALDMTWATPNLTLTTQDGSALSSVLTPTGQSLIDMVYSFSFGELTMPLTLLTADYTVLAAGANMTKKFGDAAFTQAATGGNGGR